MGWSQAVRKTTRIDASQTAAPSHHRSERPAATERVQKLLSAAGIGSRREVERWIREGRLQITAKCRLGAKLALRDRITLDGTTGQIARAGGSRNCTCCCFIARRVNARSEGRYFARAEHLNLRALRPVACDPALRGRRRSGNSHRRRFLGASSVARVHALTVDYVLRMARAAQRWTGRGISRRPRTARARR